MKVYMMRRYGRRLVLALAALALGVALALWLPREATAPSGTSDSATLQEAVHPDSSGPSTPGASPVGAIHESPQIQDVVEVQVTRRTPEASPVGAIHESPLHAEGAAQAPPPGGEQASMSDSVELILRDASGKVKQVVRGQ